MPEDDFYTPTDMDALRMENELLAFEVSFLKAQRSGAGKRVGSSTSLSRISHLEEAEQDLVLLLRRIDASPLGLLARTRINFRKLKRRYLESGDRDSLPPEQRIAYLEGAERDLELVLERLGRGLLGSLFRRRKSFRTLEERYL